jgi:toxin ParE1/3/4
MVYLPQNRGVYFLFSPQGRLGQNYTEIDLEIYGDQSGQYIIFYRILNKKEIEIFRFLHSRMDLKNRIQE